MLSHVHIGVRDFDKALGLYAAVLAELGWTPKFVEHERPWAGWKPSDQDRPLFLIGHPYNGAAAHPGNGQMVALLATSREAVDRAHATALAHGASNEGNPALRPEYHPNYYGAYVRDQDGNKLCMCCHDGE